MDCPLVRKTPKTRIGSAYENIPDTCPICMLFLRLHFSVDQRMPNLVRHVAQNAFWVIRGRQVLESREKWSGPISAIYIFALYNRSCVSSSPDLAGKNAGSGSRALAIHTVASKYSLRLTCGISKSTRQVDGFTFRGTNRFNYKVVL